MLLGVIPLFFFRFWGFLEKNRKRAKKNKSWHIRILRCSVGNPHRRVDLHRTMGCLAAARSECQNGTPRVRHGIAKLHHDVAIVHREQISDFYFRTPRIHTPIV